MRLLAPALAVVFLGLSSGASGAAIVGGQNFLVAGLSQDLAKNVLTQAELDRQEIALEWRSDLAPRRGPDHHLHRGVGPRNVGLTLPIDSPGRKFHRIWLCTSKERATGSTLRHEVAHVTLFTRFPQGASLCSRRRPSAA